jgi:phosphotransferase system enzyme I (PtsI)
MTSTMIFGEVASSGLARGPAFVFKHIEEVAVPRRTIDAGEALLEMKRFDEAIVTVEQDLLRLRDEVLREVGKQEALIFEAQILIAQDPSLRHAVSTACLVDKRNVEAAVEAAFEQSAALFGRLKNPYFRERAADLGEVEKRVLDVLSKRSRDEVPVLPEGGIVVASQLLSSVMAQLDSRTIRGLIVEKGGQTAHATILARARGIPLLIHVTDATKTIRSGDQLIVDGLAGRVFVNPNAVILREYDRLGADLRAHQSALKELIGVPAMTRDGVTIKLSANIGKLADAVVAASLNADSAGLYRTEFVFLAQDRFPSEDEQYRLYRATAERLSPREVVIRVLDIGSDKLLPYFPFPAEANPSLGRRGTRLLLAHPEILRTQLRAILRVSATHAVSILFPMIGGVEDLLAAKVAIEGAMADLTADHQVFNPRVPVGAMIETPAAAIMVGRLAQEVDFFSVGTNDLVQYLLTTDRTSSEMASYYEPLHPAVLQMLAAVSAAARAKNKSVSICGEIAGNPAFTQLLLGLGFRSLSVNPGELLEVKRAIRATFIPHAERLAMKILELGTIREIKECLRAVASQELRPQGDETPRQG